MMELQIAQMFVVKKSAVTQSFILLPCSRRSGVSINFMD